MTAFVPVVLDLQLYGRIYDPGVKPYRPRARWDLDFVPRGNSRCVLAPLSLADQR